MDMSKLKEISQSSETANTMFTDWALRRRNRSALTLRRYKSRIAKLGTCDSVDYMRTFRLMEEVGAGHLVYSNKKAVRWEWRMPIKYIGAAVFNEQPMPDTNRRSFTATMQPQPIYDQPVKREVVAPKPDKSVTLAIPLPSGRIIEIAMAQGLSSADIDSLGSVLASLKGRL